MNECPYCWDSHGCDLKEGHEVDHVCLDETGGVCSRRPRGCEGVFHASTFEPEVIEA